MPAKVRKTTSGDYSVSTPNMVHAKHTTKAKAESQQRLLNAIDHGWKPTKAPKGKTKNKYDDTHGEFCMKRAWKNDVTMP